MKRALTFLLLTLFALPSFLQVMPHGVDHALHQSKAQHNEAHHGHSHDDHHGHGHAVHKDTHHAIHLDIVTFYDEYLHAELRSAQQTAVELPDQGDQSTSFDIALDVILLSRYELSPSQSRAPPNWRSFRAEKTPLYLSTLRLRI